MLYFCENSSSLAVALNCGTGSSFLNALVNAFDKLHIVRGENSVYCGWSGARTRPGAASAQSSAEFGPLRLTAYLQG